MSRNVRRPAEAPWSAPDVVAVVRATVEAHRPADGREARSRRLVLAALSALARPFDRLAATEHVTGSAVVVGPRGTVLHLHKRLHRWLQPGGHLEPGETPWGAALREAQEETGLSLAHPTRGPRLIHVDVHRAAQAHTHLDLRYLVVGPDRDPAPPARREPRGALVRMGRGPPDRRRRPGGRAASRPGPARGPPPRSAGRRRWRSAPSPGGRDRSRFPAQWCWMTPISSTRGPQAVGA